MQVLELLERRQDVHDGRGGGAASRTTSDGVDTLSCEFRSGSSATGYVARGIGNGGCLWSHSWARNDATLAGSDAARPISKSRAVICGWIQTVRRGTKCRRCWATARAAGACDIDLRAGRGPCRLCTVGRGHRRCVRIATASKRTCKGVCGA